MKRLVVMVLTCVLCIGCASKSETQQTSEVSENAPEAAYIHTLNALTKIMRQNDADPAVTLEAVRQYVEQNKKRIAEDINSLNRAFLDMNEEQRLKAKKNASPNVQKALDEFAQAQITLKSRMNDAQKWELSEVLSQLK